MPFAQTGFPADFPFSDRTGITDHPTRFADDLTQAELVRGYTVRPTDIDFGRHMNNVAYVRVLLDCFSAAELASAPHRVDGGPLRRSLSGGRGAGRLLPP